MLYIEPTSDDAAFHFAAEEYIMGRFDQPVRMLWRTGPCAMLGANQIAGAEIDLDAAQASGVQIVRRPSGGGTIFTDPGVLLYTVVLPRAAGADVKALGRTQAAQPIADALADMGVPAQLEGRNDITVEGKKISGLAQHLKKDALCTHGSLLYDADLDTLTRVLKPDEEKIRSKAVPSLRARVTNLKPYVGLSLPDFLSALRRALFARFDMTEYACTPEDLSGIETIRRAKYANPDWTYGRAPRFDVHNQKRFPQGKAEVFLSVERGVIAACTLRGDFLSVLPIQDLERHLEGTPYRPETLTKALARPDLPLYIGGIPPEDLLTLLL